MTCNASIPHAAHETCDGIPFEGWVQVIEESRAEFLEIEERRMSPQKPVSIHDLVAEDLADRKEQGLKTYGRVLHVHNGRSALQDLYEELLDAACYIKQKIEEDRIDGYDKSISSTD